MGTNSRNSALVVIYTIISIVFFTSCNNGAQSDIVKSYSSSFRSIDEFSDSVFVSDIQDICYGDNSIYFSDIRNHQIICTDKDFQLIGFIGRPGKGPGDLVSPCGLAIDNNQLNVYSVGTKKINIYSLETFHFQEEIKISQNFYRIGFLAENGTIIGSSGMSEYPIQQINSHGSLISQFGSNNHIYSLNDERPRDFFFEVMDDEKSFLAVCKTESIIEKYDLEGNQLLHFDYSNYAIINNIVDYNNEAKSREIGRKGTYNLVVDTHFSNEELIVLIYSLDDLRNKVSKTLLIFNYAKNKIELDRIIILNRGVKCWYTVISRNNNILVAYDALNYKIDLFNIL